MVETSEISVQTDNIVNSERIFKTPEYNRILNKKYREKNKKKELERKKEYRRKKLEINDEHYIQKIKDNNKKQYLKKKATGITPEEKAKKAAYMKEYRARKKLEKELSKNV